MRVPSLWWTRQGIYSQDGALGQKMPVPGLASICHRFRQVSLSEVDMTFSFQSSQDFYRREVTAQKKGRFLLL
jgi:hypothetical protein